jgi:Tfp pilus assembly PilM family ATPase
MAQKTMTSVGIEFDSFGLRAAKLTSVNTGKNIRYAVDNITEIKGNFSKDEELVGALQQVKEKLSISSRDRLVGCVSGKQVHVAQIQFRRLPDHEMATALKFEIRKNLPFDAASASIDYQVLDSKDTASENVRVLVTAVANSLLKKHLQVLTQAELKPWIIDVMPIAIANTFWAGEYDPVNMSANVIMHFAPEVCTLIIDGNGIPFYCRSIYFSAEELFGVKSAEASAPAPVPVSAPGQALPQQQLAVTDQERERRIKALGEELARSLSFYEKTNSISNFGGICLLGDYIQAPELLNAIHGRLNLRLKAPSMLQKLHSHVNAPPGKLDVAICLAMRTDTAQLSTK